MSPLVYLGNAMIGLAVGFSLFGMISFYIGRRMESPLASSLGRGSIYGNLVFMTVANLAMIYALLSNDFGVSYVTHVGARETPRWISAISLWSSLEGSILFWGWILTGYSAVCIYLYRENDERMMNWVGLTLHAVALFFFLLLALPANPFLPVNPAPANGPGPNPLLQNHWLMAVHPPCLYMGYIGFTIPFAFAIATLLEAGSTRWGPSGESGISPDSSEHLALPVRARRWTLFAWSFQSIAIVLGGWWSYAVLGWGGYWAWDPVENASFMPWLSGTALVHSVMVQEKRKLLPVWNLSLAVLTFLLTILGTFLTRSGVLDSVHSFTESHVGPYFLIFIGVVLAISLALLLWKGSLFKSGNRFENVFSLEVLFLFNNLLFLSFCFVVFLGTLYPLVVEAIKGTRISVGEPYFNQMTVPIVGMILLLMGIGLVTPWKKTHLPTFISSARLPAILALIPTAVSLLVGGRRPWIVAIVYLAAVAFFIMLLETVRVAWRRAERKPGRLLHAVVGMLSDNPRRYGGFVAHTGALLIIVAVGLSSTYEREQEVTLKRGESASLQGYTLQLNDIVADQLPQRFEVKALVDVSQNGRWIKRLTPQMNFYPSSREPIGTPAVHSTWKEDLYLTLIHFEKNGSQVALKVIVSPAVIWIWIGGGIVMLGGLLALTFGRKKSVGQAMEMA